MSSDNVKVKKGSLTVVGSGLSVGQMTLETRAQIEASDKVVYLVCDPMTEGLLAKLNHTAESLQHFYQEQKIPRAEKQNDLIQGDDSTNY